MPLPASQTPNHSVPDDVADSKSRQAPTRDRKYDILYLTDTGQIRHVSRIAPGIPVFEDAFAALGHGAVLQTETGPCAVEDLLPGDRIRLADGYFDTLLWRGAITLTPDDAETPGQTCNLIRIMADALGYLRPSPDLVLGPTARLLHKARGVRALTGQAAAFIPARDFADGSNIIALRPAASVNVYQLGFARQQEFCVNGIEIESLHPGTSFTLGLRRDLLKQYLSLFPHKRSLEDFGLMKFPRLRLRDLDLLDGH